MDARFLSRLLLLVTALVGPGSLQNEFTFLSEPIYTIYTYEGLVTILNCTAVKINQEGKTELVEVTFYRNSEPISKYSPPHRHIILLDDVTKIPFALLIRRSLPEDTGSTYSCAVVKDGVTAISTGLTILYVGNGRPFPVSSVDLLDQQLYSLTIGWGVAPSPPDRPIQGYTIVVDDPNLSALFEMDVDGNDTVAELLHLQPSTTYGITVYGRNADFDGQPSREVLLFTQRPVAPPQPSRVSVMVQEGNHSSSIVVSWPLVQIEPDIMTPVDKYRVYFGRASSRDGLLIEETSDNLTTSLTIADITQGGNYTVGVAAVNSAGPSGITFVQGGIVPGCGVLGHPVNGRVRFGGIGVRSMAVYSCNEGYSLNGSEVRHCLPSGAWSGIEPMCELVSTITEPVLSTLEIGVIAGASMAMLLLVVITIVVLVCFCRMRRGKSAATHSFDVGQGSPSVRKSGEKPTGRTHMVTESSSDGSFNSGAVIYTANSQVIGVALSLPPAGDTSASSSADSDVMTSTTFMTQ